MRTNRTFLQGCLSDDSEIVKNGKGKNIIPPPKREPLWRAYLDKFKDPIIIVLLVVFVFSIGVSLYEAYYLGHGSKMLIEPIGILTALLLATGVGFIFEVKAEKEFEILNTVKDSRPVKVYRKLQDGKIRIRQIEKQDVCVGDYIYLENGDEVPADGILYESNSLIVDESNFTGEPYTRKSAYQEEFDEEATYASNKILRGSTLSEGNAIYLVEQIGVDTVEGQGTKKIQEGRDVQTPLNKQLAHLGRVISTISFVIAILIVLGRLIYFFFFDGDTTNHTLLEIAEFTLASIMLAVTLIVVAVPEGLPMSVTVSLALSMRKMLKENNLVRKLHACETMGATTVICTDKTGTLTQNKMTVVETDFYGEEASELINMNISLNSTAEISIDDNGHPRAFGNPTEGALLGWLKVQNIDYEDYRAAYSFGGGGEPFSPERKYMRMEFQSKDENAEYNHIRLIKGAPEIVLNMCEQIAANQSKEHVLSKLELYQSKAMRTLAFASQEKKDGIWSPLTFDGIVGIADPIRSDVKGAIEKCTANAGIRVIIVTGDNIGTANEIGHQVGLIAPGDMPQSMTGEDFAKMSDEQAMEIISRPDFKIISRARPDDKARLVTLLQKLNEVVAVTGDGTNDAPALSKAQVGLSMGDGTSTAKEASDITILDNSFSSIVKAIVWGRSLYLNIRRFIIFQMTINICACLIVLVGSFTGLESPLTVTQMLWVNLIMDTFAAMALSSLPADKRMLNDKPRDPNSFIVDKQMFFQIIGVGGVFFMLLLGLWQLLWHIDIKSVQDLLTLDSLKLFFTDFAAPHTKPHIGGYESGVFFSIFVMLQFWNLFNAKYFRTGRSLLEDIINLFTNPDQIKQSYSKGFLWILLIILVGQISIVTFAGGMFNVSPLTVQDWCIIFLITSPILIIPDIIRFIKKKITIFAKGKA